MKKTIFTILVVFTIFTNTFAQELKANPRHNRLGITYASFGKNDVVWPDVLDGAPSYNGDKFYALGIRYLHPVYSDWLDIEAALEYAHHTFTVSGISGSGEPITPYNINYSMISLPIGARVRFLQFLFANAGFLIDIGADASSPIDSQDGIGLYLGIGIEYDFLPGFSLFINPYQKVHTLLPFAMDKNHQRILEGGVTVGVMFGL